MGGETVPYNIRPPPYLINQFPFRIIVRTRNSSPSNIGLGITPMAMPNGAKFLGRILHLLNRHFHDPRLLGLEEGGPSHGHSHGSPQMREHHWLHDLHRAWSNLHFVPNICDDDAQALVRMGGSERESLERTFFSMPAYRSLRLKGVRRRAVPQNSWCR